MLWLQGMYVYEAIGDMAPILQAFAKKGTKPTPYPTEPYPLNADVKEKQAERKKKTEMNAVRTRLETWMVTHNARLKAKEVASDGSVAVEHTNSE